MKLAVGAPPAFHVMAKPTGAVCNLSCIYCYIQGRDHHASLHQPDRRHCVDEEVEAKAMLVRE